MRTQLGHRMLAHVVGGRLHGRGHAVDGQVAEASLNEAVSCLRLRLLEALP